MKKLLLYMFLVITLPSASYATHNEAQEGHDSIIETARNAGSFDILLAALDAAGLTDTLEGHDTFTVFAPTDEAFKALPRGTVENLLKPENKDQLIAILTYHVVEGRITSDDLLETTSARTANGTRLPIGLSIGPANVVKTDIRARNGIIHVIDAVLLPEMPAREITEATELIEYAIDLGAPLYNKGQKAACAAIYEVATKALLQRDDLPPAATRALRKAQRAV